MNAFELAPAPGKPSLPSPLWIALPVAQPGRIVTVPLFSRLVAAEIYTECVARFPDNCERYVERIERYAATVPAGLSASEAADLFFQEAAK